MTKQIVKVASLRLGREMEKRYEALAEAELSGDQDKIIEAATPLGMLFNDNIPFIIWALYRAGGKVPLVDPEPQEQPKITMPGSALVTAMETPADR